LELQVLYAVSLALPFIGCRELYAILTTFLTSQSFATSLVAKVLLMVVPEMIAVTVFTAVGLSTLKIAQKIRAVGTVQQQEGGMLYSKVNMEASTFVRGQLLRK
jgi:hypothetical protein